MHGKKRRPGIYIAVFLVLLGFIYFIWDMPVQQPSFEVEAISDTVLTGYYQLIVLPDICIKNYLPEDYSGDSFIQYSGVGPLDETFFEMESMETVLTNSLNTRVLKLGDCEIKHISDDEEGSISRTEQEQTKKAEGKSGRIKKSSETIKKVADDLEEKNIPRLFYYTVKPGETLWDIARKFNIDVATIAGVNPDLSNVNLIKAGQKIRLMNMKGTLHKVHPGETLWDIARNYKIPQSEIIKVNKIKNPGSLRIGQELILPGAKPLDLASRGWGDDYIWPLKGRISSRFGWRWGRFHYGLDIAVPTGTPIRASKSGRVIFSGFNGGYGLVIYIDHQDGTETRYAHCSRLIARKGNYVYKGQVIAYSGNTGNSTGPHLHFEIRIKGRAKDPLRFLK